MKGSVQGDKEGVKWEMHREKQIFYIWPSDSSEGGRERKDKVKKITAKIVKYRRKSWASKDTGKGQIV